MTNSVPIPTILDQYTPMAMRLAYRILGTKEAAADAVQEGLIKAYQALARFDGGNLRAWFLRIVTNTCLDTLRRQKQWKLYSLEAFIDEQVDDYYDNLFFDPVTPEHQYLQNESLQVILQSIERLPVEYRLILQRIDIEGYGYAEVAAQLDLPMGTIKSRLFRARMIARQYLIQLQVYPTQLGCHAQCGMEKQKAAFPESLHRCHCH